MAPPATPRVRVQRGGHDSPFFRSKFRVPAAPAHFVRRGRLVRLLDDLAQYPVNAIVAPAGAGKTALAADWVRQTRKRSVWLALDASDRHARQLVTALATAVDPLAPGCAGRAISTLHQHDDPLEATRVLVEALESAGAAETLGAVGSGEALGPVDTRPAVLVIDDLHCIDDEQAATEVLESFVRHRPEWLSLLLVSRRRLPLPVDRLRADGLLADLDFDALRFSDDEATQLLTSLCGDAAPDDVPGVAAWAGGWGAAIQLAALAARSKGTPALPRPLSADEPSAAPGRLVGEYLWHEVLHAERAEIVGVLLSVSVVERVSYSLAEALTGEADAGDLLAEAERRGLFVTSLESGGWFELHALVREMLLVELGRRWPERLASLHARAARWFESVGDTTSTIEHWLAAGRPREAVRLLADVAVDLVDTGRRATIRRSLDPLSAGSLGTDPDALVEFAWSRLLVDRAAFDAALLAAEAVTARSPDTDGRLMILRAASAFESGDWTEGEAGALLALERLGDRAGADSLARYGWSLAAHGLALDERWLEGGEAVGRARLGVGHDVQRSIALEGTRAIGLVLAGHPVDALRAAAGVRRAAQETELGALRLELALAEALAAKELGDQAKAHEALHRLADEPAYPSAFVQLLAQLELLEVQLATGDLDAAGTTFQLASERCEHELTRPGAKNWLARRGVLLSLARGDHDSAVRWSRRLDDPFWRPVSDARIELAQGHAAEAGEALSHSQPRSSRHQVIQHLLLGQAHRDDRGTAEKEIAVAIELAAEEGMLQTVGGEGHQVLELLELSAWRVPEGWMDRLRRVVVAGAPAPEPTAEPMVEELTSREYDVLRLLPSRLTVREIASELFVSHNTLKFHLRVIYQKLGVNSRAEAVGRARRLGLLGRH